MPNKDIPLSELLNQLTGSASEAYKASEEPSSLSEQEVIVQTGREIAIGLFWLFSIVIGGFSFVGLGIVLAQNYLGISSKDNIDLILEMTKVLLPYIATPFAVAIGFYFRGQSNANSSG